MLTQSQALDLFDYDFETGVLTWRDGKRGHTKAGDRAGSVMNNGNGKRYLIIKISGERYLAHRVCWLYVYGEFPSDCIDHINGNGLDNRLNNLRSVTRTENQRNMKVNAGNKTGVMGVYWDKRSKRWVSRIGSKNKDIYLGCSVDLFEAICKRKSAEIEYGYHKNHGQIRPL